MKKRLFRITALLTVVALLVYANGGMGKLFAPRYAEAVGDLSVDWGVPSGNPIFNAANMAPGDVQTHTVSVANGASTTRPVGVRGIKTTETGNLADAFDFVIRQGVVDIYGGTSPTGPKTISHFFADSAGVDGIYLSDLAASANTSYTFIATFKTDSGNEYQGKQLVFDLQIGLSIDLPAECDAIQFNGSPIYGTENNDNLHGTNKNDLIIALEGNDKVNTGSGNDCVIAGPGSNKVETGSGNDVVTGGEGDDTVETGSGIDVVYGFGGNNKITTGSENDKVYTLDGDDNIDVGSGDDTVYAGGGNDRMSGGSGNDYLNGEAGADRANAGSGTDTCMAEIKNSCEL